MKAAAEISMYPLDKEYIPPIEDFIGRLRAYKELNIQVNAMSTQIFGPYDRIMEVLTRELRGSFEQPRKFAVVIKLLNVNLE